MNDFTKAELNHLNDIHNVLVSHMADSGKAALTWDEACDAVNASATVARNSNLYICKAWSDLKA